MELVEGLVKGLGFSVTFDGDTCVQGSEEHLRSAGGEGWTST